MSNNSKIEWTETTWNPVTGCTKVSAGCDACYAEGIATRFAGTKAFPNGFAVTLHPNRLRYPFRWRKPRRVFVNSMSDLFHADVPDEYIASVFAVMAATPQHTYQVLTKRHGRMKSLLSNPAFARLVYTVGVGRGWGITGEQVDERADRWAVDHWPLRNVWLGVSVESQQWADIRIPALVDTPAAVRFLSCEPLLGPVDLKFSDALVCGCGQWDCGPYCGYPVPQEIDWVIVGGESGRGARPMDLGWAQSLVDQCQKADVAVFVKQLGSRWGRDHHDIEQFPAGLQVREYPTTAVAVTA